MTQIFDKKSGKLVSVLLYFISFILISSYFGVLYLAKNPDVCIEYKLYYIDKTLDDWPGYGGLDYRLGETINFGTDFREQVSQKRKGRGWLKFDRNGVWTSEMESIMFFNLGNINEQDIKLNIVVGNIINDEVHTDSKVSIYANGNLISDFKPDSDNYNFECIIPKKYISDGMLELKFANSNPLSVVDENNQDYSALLGFKLYSVKMEEI